MTKEQMADRLGTAIEQGKGDVFMGFSAARISAILQFGASKEELQKMTDNATYSIAKANGE